MTSPEAPQPPQDELQLPPTPKSDSTDEPPLQDPSKDIVPEPNPDNVNTKVSDVDQAANSVSVADGVVQEAQGGVKEHKDLVQELQDRFDGLEQRLRQAGLLKKPKGRDRSQTPSQEDWDSRSRSLKRRTTSWSLHDGKRDNKDPGRAEGSMKDKTIPEASVQVLQDRINSLEKRLEESGHLKEKPAVDKPRQPAVPQLHYIDWSEFKNKLAEEEKVYAIEVLTGGAKYYHQRSEEEKKNKQRWKDHSNDHHQPLIDNKKSTTMPERIRINSKSIMLIMNQIDPMEETECPAVMLRPFKPLIYHEARIREVYQKLIEKWGSADTEVATHQAAQSKIPKDGGGSTIQAESDEAVNPIPADGETQNKAETAPKQTIDDNLMPTTSDKNVTRRDSMSPSSTAPPPVADGSIEQGAQIETEKDTSKTAAEAESQGRRDEETEDLTDCLEALRDLRCLIKFIDEEVKPVADSYRDMTRQKIQFCDLWHLFKPGDLLHIPLGNKQSSDIYQANGTQYLQMPDDRFQEVWRVACTAAGRPHLERSTENYGSIGHKSTVNAFLISAYWVDFNAARFVYRTFVFYMIPFPGERDITSLYCYPLRYSPKAGELKAKWKARGEAFREYTTFKYRYYIGKTLTCAPDGYRGPESDYPKHAEHIDSQVVVDFSEGLSARPGWRTSGAMLGLNDDDSPGETVEDYPTLYWKDSHRKVLDEERDDEIYDDEHIDNKMLEEYIDRDPLLRDHPMTSPAGNGDLDENHLVLLPNRVFAFVMKNRKWAILTVDGLRPIKRYDGGFNDLQLPTQHKRTISSLVDHHFINRNVDLDNLEASYDADLVRGKGKGLIILLHGAPGVGKTSTAETVADAYGKVLLPITCGDLGLTAAHVERELSDKFHLAELWDCVLLLDEADVFLARRTNDDIKRNSLVSVFLRVLEYFTGVLFLTTNRVGSFDEAFQSRIHISLYYPPLDKQRTWSIWKMNLERLKEKKQRRNEHMFFNENEIFTYALSHFAKTFPRRVNWNGRQIRNAFQTASALAEFEAHEWNQKAQAKSLETGKGFVPKNPQLRVRHFEEIAWASSEFDNYIFETKGSNLADIAHMEGQRTDDYRPSRRPVRDSRQQQTQMREAPVRNPVPNLGPRQKVQGQATSAGRASDTGNRQMNARSPVTFAYDTADDQGSLYDQPLARRDTNPVNNYGSRTAATLSRGERPTTARSRPKTVQDSSIFAGHDRDRRRPSVYEQPEPQLEYDDEEEADFEQPFEGSMPQPLSTHTKFEDTTQREFSPRRRQVGDFSAASRKPPARTYADDFENDDEDFDR